MLPSYFPNVEILIGTVVVAVVTAVIAVFLSRKRKNLPPLIGPSWRENLQQFSTLANGTIAKYPHELAKMLEAQCPESCNESTGCGVIFRMSMPQLTEFIMCSDYKIVREIMEGDESKGILEAEKSPMLKVFDLYPGKPSLIS